MKRITVKARPGSKVPMDAIHTRYIGEEPVEVASSSYYRRRIRSGELIQVEKTTLAPPVPRVQLTEEKEG